MKEQKPCYVTIVNSQLEELEQLKDTNMLEKNQSRLCQLLRSRYNFKVTETILTYIRDIQVPTDGLLVAVLGLLRNTLLYYDARILAAEALVSMICNQKNTKKREMQEKLVQQTMSSLIESSHPSRFRDVLLTSVPATREHLPVK
ncbi:hypothetical protein ACFL27_15150 [candidate division CSSED10-310 bacterium]|uniref:Uncharacterized protein n=1 Tax=candidate division CSSED10-310 bacterium TaxID=2855610 RepID=A0ABV6YZB0_UNCC1